MASHIHLVHLTLLLAILMSVTQAEVITLQGAEEAYRSLVEQNNLHMIEAQNQQGTSFELGANKFIRMTPAEFAERYGSPEDSLPAIPTQPMIGAINIIKSNRNIDWRTSGKVSGVKNQGSACNSCYAFVATADIETSYLLASQKVTLSEQQIIDCTSSYGNNGCTNGFYGYTFEYAKTHPLASSSDYPYTGTSQSCKEPSQGYKISSYLAYKGNSCSFLESMLQMRPVSVSVDGVNFYWQFYRRGVLSNCGRSNKLNHGVQVVGMGQEGNSSWWIAKNSWGTEWGENGYIRLDKTVSQGNICLVCSYIYHSQL